ncbi:CdaR family transcriptional regulator [Lachnospira multipara]|uniref:CdaR family transcriptional regulator n=1 Tax=Lachnospira multipara TaxID=28051 RepID=UPI0004E11D44|nr:sugar diacid recognition domain-containing protein [Lachnospira multipara]
MKIDIREQLAGQIVDAIKSICDHDINFIKVDGYISASTNPERVGAYHEAGKNAAMTGKTVIVNNDNKLQGTRKGINMPIIHNGETVAVIGITGEPKEVQKYAYLAQRITLLLVKEHELELNNHDKKAQINYVIHSLIDEDNINIDFLKQVMRSAGINDFEKDFTTVVIKLSSRYNPLNLSLIETDIVETIKQLEGSIYTFNYPNEYLIISDSSVLDKKLFILENLASRNKKILKIGIGDGRVITRQCESYKLANLALFCNNKEGSISRFSDLDIEILLSRVPLEFKNTFLQKTVENINDEDREILKIYFEEDMSLKNTCDKLFMHKNTLQYKLNRIAANTGYNPRSFKDACVLYTALKILDISKN